jgi:ABC-2 type transport system permease protein
VGELRAYAALFGGRLRSATAYRTSFAVEMVTNAAGTLIDVVTVFVLYHAAASVGGFTLDEALMMTGITAFAFVLADLTVGNIDQLETYVRTGRLDAVLVRPLAVLPQLILADLPLRKLMRLAVGTGVLGLALARNDVDWTPARALLLVTAPISGAVFFGAIFVLSAASAFWWIDSGKLGHGFTYGGRDFTSYPITVYGSWFRTLFAYGLGFGFVSYQPALTLLGRADPLGLPSWAGYLSPLIALVVSAVAAVVWRLGVRHYRSTGS